MLSSTLFLLVPYPFGIPDLTIENLFFSRFRRDKVGIRYQICVNYSAPMACAASPIRILRVHLALRIARAAATVLRRHGDQRPQVVMGRDTRLSGDMIEAAMLAGFCSAGADVISVGVLPTAGIAYLARVLDVDMGAMISASHNPFEFNGIKFFSHEGFKLPDAWKRRSRSASPPPSNWIIPSGRSWAVAARKAKPPGNI